MSSQILIAEEDRRIRAFLAEPPQADGYSLLDTEAGR